MATNPTTEVVKTNGAKADGVKPNGAKAPGAKANGARANGGNAISNANRLLNALTALKKGDFTVRLPTDWTGMDGKIADAFNEVVELNQGRAHELDASAASSARKARSRSAPRSARPEDRGPRRSTRSTR